MARETAAGPVAGGYCTFALAQHTIAGSSTDLFVGEIKLPFACRIVEIASGNLTSTGGASRGTFQVTDGTSDLIDVDKLMTTANSVIVTPTSATSKLVAGERTRAKGDRLKFYVTTVASEVVTSLTFVVTVFVTAHVVVAAADD